MPMVAREITNSTSAEVSLEIDVAESEEALISNAHLYSSTAMQVSVRVPISDPALLNYLN